MSKLTPAALIVWVSERKFLGDLAGPSFGDGGTDVVQFVVHSRLHVAAREGEPRSDVEFVWGGLGQGAAGRGGRRNIQPFFEKLHGDRLQWATFCGTAGFYPPIEVIGDVERGFHRGQTGTFP